MGIGAKILVAAILLVLLVAGLGVWLYCNQLWPFAGSPPITTGPEDVLINTWNSYLVGNTPSAKAEFSVDRPYFVTYASTYHWNDGQGCAQVGTISLRHDDGTVYGPWQATGKPGQGNVPNANWECCPKVVIKPGRYTVLDSSPSTWSQNAGTGGRGITKVTGISQTAAKGR